MKLYGFLIKFHHKLQIIKYSIKQYNFTRVLIFGFTNTILHKFRETEKRGLQCVFLCYSIFYRLPSKPSNWNETQLPFPRGFHLFPFLPPFPRPPHLSSCVFDFPSLSFHPQHFWNGLRWEGEIRKIPIEPSTRGSGRHSTQMQLEGLPLREIFAFLIVTNIKL